MLGPGAHGRRYNVSYAAHNDDVLFAQRQHRTLMPQNNHQEQYRRPVAVWPFVFLMDSVCAKHKTVGGHQHVKIRGSPRRRAPAPVRPGNAGGTRLRIASACVWLFCILYYFLFVFCWKLLSFCEYGNSFCFPRRCCKKLSLAKTK